MVHSKQFCRKREVKLKLRKIGKTLRKIIKLEGAAEDIIRR